MNSNEFFWLLYGLYLVSFFWKLYVNWRQYRVYLNNETRPKNKYVCALIKNDQYLRVRNYEIEKMRFGFIQLMLELMKTTIVFFCQLLPWLWEHCGRIGLFLWPGNGEIFQSLLYFIISSLAAEIIALSFTYYETFCIRQKHGYRNDQESLLDFIIHRHRYSFDFVNVAAFTTVHLVIWANWMWPKIFTIYPIISIIIGVPLFLLIVPCFINLDFISKPKGIPFSEAMVGRRPELKLSIENLASKVLFPVARIYVEDSNPQDELHSHGHSSGFGENKLIVLNDTLLRNAPDEQVLAVFAHELGHWNGYHNFWDTVLIMFDFLVRVFLYGKLHRNSNLFAAFGFRQAHHPPVIGSILVFQFALIRFNEFISVIKGFKSHHFEFAADKFSEGCGYSRPSKNWLINLTKGYFVFPIVDWLYSVCNHSHPPTLDRLRRLK